MSKPRVAFFGLGIMGSGMARRLLANGYSLAVYNRDAKKASGFAEAGARVATSPRGGRGRGSDYEHGCG
jgi:3-hydroxyisobutyrate dehydrogenase